MYFTDYFQISPEILEEYGALNISLLSDLPLFIDPFLLFNNSSNASYQTLHEQIIQYMIFLKNLSNSDANTDLRLQHLYQFPEIKQNWLGFAKSQNNGRGLGSQFAKLLDANLKSIFRNFGEEEITTTSHIEKLTLISDGVGRDFISDFTTNLILDYLLTYTESFVIKHLESKYLKKFSIRSTVVV